MEQKKPTAKPPEYAAAIGIDWADRKHDVCLQATGSEKHEARVIPNTPESIIAWIGEVQERFASGRFAVCIEKTRCALICILADYDRFDLYLIHPKTLHDYRKALAAGGAKSDSVDAQLLLEFWNKHRDRIPRWQPHDALTRTLGMLSEDRRKAVEHRKALGNELKSLLKLYFPQALEIIGGTVGAAMACDFLLKWPTLQAAKKTRPETIRKFFYAHRCRRGDRIEQRLQRIAEAQPVSDDTALLETSVLRAQMLAKLLRTLTTSIREYDKKIDELFSQHPDAPVFKSLPGAGHALAPRLAAAFGTDRDRFDNAQAYYTMLRRKGKEHHAAVRALAFKWIRVLYRCWKNRKTYDEVRYLKVLQKRNSPLLAYIDSQKAA